MQKATVMPPRKVAYHDETETVQMRLYKSLKVWSMYADLEESFGTFKVTHYSRCLCFVFRIGIVRLSTILDVYSVFIKINM